MGTDIYAYGEIFINGKWELTHNPLETCETVLGIKTGNVYFEPIDLEFGRNYKFFSFLADIENEKFFTLVCQNRGVPADINLIPANSYNKAKEYAHSASGFSVNEILNFNYNQEIELSGYVDKDIAHLFNPKNNFPRKHWREDYKVYNINVSDLLSKNEPFFEKHTKVSWKTIFLG